MEDSADGYNVELHAKIGKGRQLNLERFQSLVRITDRLMANDDASGGVVQAELVRPRGSRKAHRGFNVLKTLNTKTVSNCPFKWYQLVPLHSGDDSVSVTWESSPVQANPLFSTRIGKITDGLLRNLAAGVVRVCAPRSSLARWFKFVIVRS